MLSAILAVPLILLGLLDDRPDEAPQLLELIHSKAATPKTLVFLYEGRMRWIGDPKLVKNPAGHDDEYQGTFLYRRDGAALYDLYHRNPSYAGGVIRSKSSVIKGRWESSVDILDRSRIGPNLIRVSNGTVNSFHPFETPGDLFPVWSLEELMITPNRKTTSEGWEPVDGRNCLKLRVGQVNTDGPERDRRFFWVDLERNAQVVKVEFYEHSKLTTRIDDIHLVEMPRGDGPPYWLPVSSRRRTFALDDEVWSVPLLERTVTVVGGSARIGSQFARFLLLRDQRFGVAGARRA